MDEMTNSALTAERCIDFALSALEKKDYLACLHNLNDGIALMPKDEELGCINEIFFNLFEEMGSVDNMRDIVVRDFCSRTEGSADYTKLDFDVMVPNFSPYEEEACEFITLESINDYNRFRALCAERKYAEALQLASKFPSTPQAYKVYLDGLTEADRIDPGFNFNDYFNADTKIPIVESEEHFRMLSLMLRSGGDVKDLVVDAAEYILYNARNLREMVLMGRNFYLENEMECAKKFFKKALEYSCIEANSLYYLNSIYRMNGETEQAERCWNTFKAVFKSFNLPIALMEEFFDSKHSDIPTPYRTLPEHFQSEYADKLQKMQIAEESESAERKVLEFLMLANDYHAMSTIYHFLDQLDIDRERFALNVLKNSWISDGIKRIAFEALLKLGYEGQIQLITGKNAKSFIVSKLGYRVNKNWRIAYQELIKTIAFADMHIPVKCNLLAQCARRLYNMTDFKHVESEVAMVLLWFYYAERIKVNIQNFDVFAYLNISKDAIEKAFVAFSLLNLEMLDDK